MYGRGSYEHGESVPFNGFGNIGTSSGDGPNVSDNYNITLNAFYTFNPTTILSVNYGLGRFAGIRYPISEGTTPASLGFSKTFSDIAGLSNYEFPEHQRRRRLESGSGDLHDPVESPDVACSARGPHQGTHPPHDQSSVRNSASCS